MENINKINFQDLFISLLSQLSEREQEILKQRYQLTSDLERRATLKQIGDNYKITRERVRQIEKESIRKLVAMKSQPEFTGQLNQLENELLQYIKKNGGIVREDKLLSEFAEANHTFDFLHSNSYLFVLDNFIDSVLKSADHDNFYKIWFLQELNLDKVNELLEKTSASIEEKGNLLSEQGILNIGKEHLDEELTAMLQNYLDRNDNVSLENFLISYLNASRKVEKNILDQWGLANWKKIRPQKLGDKIFLIFEKETKPLHFREIAEKINQSKFDHKNICPATVHNELIANDQYVLIGRGIYALKTWGYATGTVADIIENILKKSAEPLNKDDIYNEVLKQRQVNKSTIYLTLINKDQFEKDANGKFFLKN
ncbi:hypothetical protein KKC32_03105 [Patescibacteria group bacterium]|nr:hypothetical protein [Patescibacteria group bacterium]